LKTLSDALEFRFLPSKKPAVGKAAAAGLYSGFHRMINSNSENFLS